MDIFANSLILKWVFGLFKKAAPFFYYKNAKIIPALEKIAIWGIVLLIFSVALTPKIHTGSVNTVIIPMRIDDLLLVIIAIITLFKMSLNKAELKPTNLDMPILLFLGAVILSTFRSFFIHTTDKPIINILYVLKIIEYFLIFYLTVYNIKNEKQVKLCLGAVITSCVVLSLIGIWEYFHPFEIVGPVNYYRLYERGLFRSESNHFGGYFVFLIGIAGGFVLFTPGLKKRIYWALFSLLIFFPLLWTYSRQSYLALAGPIIILPLFKKNTKFLIATLCVIAVLLSVLLLTQPLVRDRLLEIKDTFFSGDPYQSSFAFRMVKWKDASSSFTQFPLLGTGLGSRHRAFYESNQVLLLSELGIFGYGLFLFLLFVILRGGIKSFNNAKSDFFKALSAGFTAGFIGLVLHSFACNTFMITRIAGPFWVAAGLLFSQDKKDVIH